MYCNRDKWSITVFTSALGKWTEGCCARKESPEPSVCKYMSQSTATWPGKIMGTALRHYLLQKSGCKWIVCLLFFLSLLSTLEHKIFYFKINCQKFFYGKKVLFKWKFKTLMDLRELHHSSDSCLFGIVSCIRISAKRLFLVTLIRLDWKIIFLFWKKNTDRNN